MTETATPSKPARKRATKSLIAPEGSIKLPSNDLKSDAELNDLRVAAQRKYDALVQDPKSTMGERQAAREDRKAAEFSVMERDNKQRESNDSKIQSPEPPISDKEHQASAIAEKAAFTRKEPGAAMFQMKDVPAEFVEAAKLRFGRVGRDMNVATARENGSYKGDVLNGGDYLAQRVADNSVVFHEKGKIELMSEKHVWLDKEQRLNGSQMAVYYDGKVGKAFPHDPQREELNKLVGAMKKTAERLAVPGLEQFGKNLDMVKEGMLAQFKEKRQEHRQQTQAERQRPDKQHAGMER